MGKRAKILYMLLMAVILSIGLCGCKEKSGGGNEDFDQFMQQVFCEEVQQDSITLNYTLAHPENFDIKDVPVTFGDYGVKADEKSIQESEELLKKLESYSYKKLTEEQQLTYDIMKHYLETSLEGKDYEYYSGNLSPTIGIQAELPILLSEFSFYDEDDIRIYLELLTKLEDYFAQILSYEQERAKAGFGMTDYAIDDIIGQCESFIEDPEKNVLIQCFPSKLADFESLNEDERLAMEYDNQQAVINHVIPAYQNLIEGLKTLKGQGKNEQGLCYYPNGKEYYEYLIKSGTGSDRSMTEIKQMLQSKITDAMLEIYSAAAADETVVNRVEDPNYLYTEPTDILSFLETAILDEYPAIDETNYTIKYVDESMQEDLSPAFFLTPALDNWDNLSIYINQNPAYDQSDLFTTLAHEGYPGHLYQNVFFMQTNPESIRGLLSFGGYSEGWATYTEVRAYKYGGLDKNLASALAANRVAILAISSWVDIGIHYDGWDVAQTAKYLMDYGLLADEADALPVYQSLIEEPGNYLRYTLGYLEFEEMRKKAEEELGDKFDPVEYHRFILGMGPAPFTVLNDKLDGWLKTVK